VWSYVLDGRGRKQTKQKIEIAKFLQFINGIKVTAFHSENLHQLGTLTIR